MHIELVSWAVILVASLLPVLLAYRSFRTFDAPAFDVPLSAFVVPVTFWSGCIYLFCRLMSAF